MNMTRPTLFSRAWVQGGDWRLLRVPETTQGKGISGHGVKSSCMLNRKCATTQNGILIDRQIQLSSKFYISSRQVKRFHVREIQGKCEKYLIFVGGLRNQDFNMKTGRGGGVIRVTEKSYELYDGICLLESVRID